MVLRIITDDGDESFMCEVCERAYVSKKNSEDCEAWCTEHKACNVDIIKHSVRGNIQCKEEEEK